jgi:hypothetical protein
MQETQKSAIETYVHSSVEEFTLLSKVDQIGLDNTAFTFQLNSALRAGIALNKETNNFCNLLDSSFNNDYVTTEDFIVYRAFNYKEMLRYIQGGTYIDLGYMSTSKSTQPVQSFFESPKIGYFPAFLKITIPASSIVLDLDNIEGFDNTTYEEEILIRRNSLFEIVSCEEVNSREFIKQIGLEVSEIYERIMVIELRFLNYLSS